jgi:hypothetical protein
MTHPQFHRTNLNLYTEDVAYMQKAYGRGWTEQARDIIHQEIKEIKARTTVYDTYQRNQWMMPNAK